MSYTLNWSNPSLPGKQPFTLNNGEVNSTAASIPFTGHGVSAYGEIQQENYMRLLENFASDTAPSAPTIGQLWYDTAPRSNGVLTSTFPKLKICSGFDGSGVAQWDLIPVARFVRNTFYASESQPVDFTGPNGDQTITAGDFWLKPSVGVLRVCYSTSGSGANKVATWRVVASWDSGPTFPSDPQVGQLFSLTSAPNTLHHYTTSNGWVQLVDAHHLPFYWGSSSDLASSSSKVAPGFMWADTNGSAQYLDVNGNISIAPSLRIALANNSSSLSPSNPLSAEKTWLTLNPTEKVRTPPGIARVGSVGTLDAPASANHSHASPVVEDIQNFDASTGPSLQNGAPWAYMLAGHNDGGTTKWFKLETKIGYFENVQRQANYASAGQFLRVIQNDGTGSGTPQALWGPSSLHLNDIETVAISAPQANQFLTFNGSHWVNSSAWDFMVLDGLGDVEVGSSPANDDTIVRDMSNGGYGVWRNKPFSTILNSYGLNNLGDVSLSVPIGTPLAAATTVLGYNGSSWVDTTLSINELNDVQYSVSGSVIVDGGGRQNDSSKRILTHSGVVPSSWGAMSMMSLLQPPAQTEQLLPLFSTIGTNRGRPVKRLRIGNYQELSGSFYIGDLAYNTSHHIVFNPGYEFTDTPQIMLTLSSDGTFSPSDGMLDSTSSPDPSWFPEIDATAAYFMASNTGFWVTVQEWTAAGGSTAVVQDNLVVNWVARGPV